MSELAVLKNSNTKTIAKTVVNQAAISLCVATLYFAMCIVNPFNMLTGAAALASFANIRWANLLRAFVIISPGAAVGIGAGAHAYNMYRGASLLGAFPVIPFIATTVGLAMYSISQKWGRSTKKDLTLIFIYGLIMGLTVTVNHVGIAVMLSDAVWAELLTFAAFWRLFTSIAVPLMGYPLVRYYESVVRNKEDEKGNLTK